MHPFNSFTKADTHVKTHTHFYLEMVSQSFQSPSEEGPILHTRIQHLHFMLLRIRHTCLGWNGHLLVEL